MTYALNLNYKKPSLSVRFLRAFLLNFLRSCGDRLSERISSSFCLCFFYNQMVNLLSHQEDDCFAKANLAQSCVLDFLQMIRMLIKCLLTLNAL